MGSNRIQLQSFKTTDVQNTLPYRLTEALSLTSNVLQPPVQKDLSDSLNASRDGELLTHMLEGSDSRKAFLILRWL